MAIKAVYKEEKTQKVNHKFKTGLELAKNFFVTGALVETNSEVEFEICRHLPKSENAVIVEFGMGHGNITQQILNTISPASKLYAFEVNPDFCEHVKQTINDKRLTIINDGAENLMKHVAGDVDGIISSIPFSFISKNKRGEILKDSHESLVNEGYFSQVLLTKFKTKEFQKVFAECDVLTLKGFPTYYIYHCGKKN
ncbi:MAG: methyltransferase [Bacteroidota bacterium]